jgi:hypothetical protein
MNSEKAKLTYELIKAFVAGTNRSLNIVNRIEVDLDEMFPEDDEIQDFITMFAMYRPGGGDYLYNEERIKKEFENLLSILQSRYAIS